MLNLDENIKAVSKDPKQKTKLQYKTSKITLDILMPDLIEISDSYQEFKKLLRTKNNIQGIRYLDANQISELLNHFKCEDEQYRIEKAIKNINLEQILEPQQLTPEIKKIIKKEKKYFDNTLEHKLNDKKSNEPIWLGIFLTKAENEDNYFIRAKLTILHDFENKYSALENDIIEYVMGAFQSIAQGNESLEPQNSYNLVTVSMKFTKEKTTQEEIEKKINKLQNTLYETYLKTNSPHYEYGIRFSIAYTKADESKIEKPKEQRKQKRTKKIEKTLETQITTEQEPKEEQKEQKEYEKQTIEDKTEDYKDYTITDKEIIIYENKEYLTTETALKYTGLTNCGSLHYRFNKGTLRKEKAYVDNKLSALWLLSDLQKISNKGEDKKNDQK